ncbi:hypothetical protein DFH27DRAFT_656496 [Peziza echinospora]|nr:hypothetical protein DFH27DRAFT_656496 [Peziza echinospora]
MKYEIFKHQTAMREKNKLTKPGNVRMRPLRRLPTRTGRRVRTHLPPQSPPARTCGDDSANRGSLPLQRHTLPRLSPQRHRFTLMSLQRHYLEAVSLQCHASPDSGKSTFADEGGDQTLKEDAMRPCIEALEEDVPPLCNLMTSHHGNTWNSSGLRGVVGNVSFFFWGVLWEAARWILQRRESRVVRIFTSSLETRLATLEAAGIAVACLSMPALIARSKPFATIPASGSWQMMNL